MPVFSPRSKTISIRVSEEEYGELKKLCANNDARSVSDVARKAMQKMIGRGPGEEWILAQLQELKVKVAHLGVRCEDLDRRLTERLEATKAS